MKESGINYFYVDLGLNTGALSAFHIFEDGVGSGISSVLMGQSQYSGGLNYIGPFWSVPGTAFFSGNNATIYNASGLDSIAWTKIIVFERINVDSCVLFDSIQGSSGYRIGITETNKPYFENNAGQPICAASLNNYSSKNAITFTYLPNYLTIGYYNFNSKIVETETFTYPFQVQRSDVQVLGDQFTGYMDYHIHLTQPISPDIQSQLLSGLWVYPTGTGYAITNVCSTGIIGYIDVFVGQTGITGYSTMPGGDEGRDYFTGQFPTSSSTEVLTGYLSTGIYISGVTGVICTPVTGSSTVFFEYLTGYASSFGMEKIQLFTWIEASDVVKTSTSYTPFNDIYNRIAQRQYSGYFINTLYTDTGIPDIFYNGVAINGYGWNISGNYLSITGTETTDTIFFDAIIGNKRTIDVTIDVTGYQLIYSGQELYLNGVNLISGDSFIATGSIISLQNSATGISGTLFEYPVVLAFQTGSFSLWTGLRFWRNTSNEYLNGVRQEEYGMYIEGAIFDMLSGNIFNPSDCITLYDNNGNYWE